MISFETYLYEPMLDMFKISIDHQLSLYVAEKVREGVGKHAYGLFLTCSGYNWNMFCDMMDGDIIPRFPTIVSFPLSVGIRFEDFYNLDSIQYRSRRRVRKRFRMKKNHTDMIKNITEYFPKRLEFLFDYLGRSQQELNELFWLLHIFPSEWKIIMNGDRIPSIKQLCGICEELGVTLETLMGFDEWIYPWERTRNLQGI